MDNKAKGSIAALVGALLYGGSQILDMESRLEALEGLHPEVTTGVTMEPHTPEDDAQDGAPPLGKPGMSAPPLDAPGPAEEPVEPEAEPSEG